MTKNKTIGLFLATFCLSVATALPVGLVARNSSFSNTTTAVAKRELDKRSAWTPNPIETPVNPDKLSALTIASTITSTSHSFQFTFSTGGQGYADNTTTYLLAPNDEGFQAKIDEINKLTPQERTELDKLNSLDENFDSIPEFNAYVFSINPSVGGAVYLPKKIFRNHLFGLSPTYIGVKAFDFSTLSFTEPRVPAQDVKIYIPDNINMVYDESFLNLDAAAEHVIFYVELSEEEVNEQWEADWNHGAEVVYDFSYEDNQNIVTGLKGGILDRVTEHQYDEEGKIVKVDWINITRAGIFLARAGASQYGDEDANYFLGYFRDAENPLPLYLEYKALVDGVLDPTPRYEQFLLASKDALWNSVGSKISSFSTTMNIDIRLAENEDIDVDSLVIHNIYAKDPAEGSREPDLTAVYSIAPRKIFATSYHIDDFISIDFRGISHFMGFTAVETTIRQGREDLYQELNPGGYRTNESNLNKGVSHIRYRVTSLSQSEYLIGYGDDKTNQFTVSSPVSQYVLTGKTNKLSFVLRDNIVASDFHGKSINSFDFVGFYVTIDIYGKNGPLARTAVATRFGYVNVMSPDASGHYFNADLLLTWLAVGYTAAFLIGATGLFFFYKEKFKNDEFRRLKPKKFITKSILSFLGSIIVLFACVFTALRATVFANAIVVFNPLDPFIIITMILSVLIIGYFLKYVVVTARAASARRKAHKLKLDEDVVEDGTN